jgi:hypothetical protein
VIEVEVVLELEVVLVLEVELEAVEVDMLEVVVAVARAILQVSAPDVTLALGAKTTYTERSGVRHLTSWNSEIWGPHLISDCRSPQCIFPWRPNVAAR